MRRIFDVKIGRSNKPQNIIDFDFSTIKIKKLWTIYDESVLYENGEKIPIVNLKPKHHEGFFFEDYVHDWDIRNGMLYYYSRVGEIGDSMKILIEYD